MPYLPHTEDDKKKMLEVIQAESVKDLFRSIPEELLLRKPLSVPEGQSEAEILRQMELEASKNLQLDGRPSFLGAGIYNRFIPALVDYLSSRGEFCTAYTPYQPEASQGTLQAIFEYQSMITRLCGIKISNASMYDGASALAEAILMAYAIRQKGTKVLVSSGIHPEHLRVLETYFRHHPIQIETLPLGSRGSLDPGALARRMDVDVFSVAIQNPNFFGVIENGPDIFMALEGKDSKPFFIASVDPISLAILRPPGTYGADVAVGEGQSLGNDPNFGGPSFGFFATRLEHVRKVPGRIVGETRDRAGRRGYVLTFQTREQHIRRGRATSNICTNQGLSSLRAAIYMASLGEKGLRRISGRTTRMAHLAHRRLSAIPGVRPVYESPFFGEFAMILPRPAGDVYRALRAEKEIIGGLPLDRYFPDRKNEMLFSCTEMTRVEDIDRLEEALRDIFLR